MSSHKKLELSKETLRDLTSDRLGDVRGGGEASAGPTCVSCLECTTTIQISPTWVNDTCWCLDTR